MNTNDKCRTMQLFSNFAESDMVFLYKPSRPYLLTFLVAPLFAGA